MATQKEREIYEKRCKSLEKARAVRRRNAKRRQGGLKGLGAMDFSKQSSLDSLKTAGFIVLGYAGGQIGGKLIEKAVVKPGDEKGFKKFIPALIQAGGGFLVSAAAGEHKVVKVLGQGMMASGVVTGIEAGTGKQITDLIGSKKTKELQGLNGEDFDEVSMILDEHLQPVENDLENESRENTSGIVEDTENDIIEHQSATEMADDDDGEIAHY